MRLVRLHEIEEYSFKSPKGKFQTSGKEISVALGREPDSLDLRQRHPYDLEVTRVAPGKAAFPYHSHSAQTELYLVLEGRGQVRDQEGTTEIEPGDAFIFQPGEAHQLINDGEIDLVFFTIADNPEGESCFYPDSRKWLVRSPERRLMRGDDLDYFDGEE